MNVKQEAADAGDSAGEPTADRGPGAGFDPRSEAGPSTDHVKHELEDEEEVRVKTEIKEEPFHPFESNFEQFSGDDETNDGRSVFEHSGHLKEYSSEETEHSSSVRQLSSTSKRPIGFLYVDTEIDKHNLKRDLLNGKLVAYVKLDRIETYKKNYVCDRCHETFPSLAILNTHAFLHSDSLFDTSDDNDAAFRCEICDFECAQTKHTKYHKIIHTKDNHIQCDSCDNECTRLITPHGKSECDGVRIFKCSTCQYKCNKYINFKYHLMIHTGEKPFECTQCDYKCITLAKLKLHEYVHGKVKPFKCNQCAYRCTQSSYLNKHKLTHSRKKFFECIRCNYKCGTRIELSAHRAVHVGEKPYGCDQCDFRCARSSYIKIHKETHLVKRAVK